MKKNLFLTKFLVLALAMALLSSCTRDLLVTKREVRDMNLVKVGAPDPVIPKAEKTFKQQDEILQNDLSVAEVSQEPALPEGPGAQVLSSTADDPGMVTVSIKGMNLDRSGSKGKSLKSAGTTAGDLAKSIIPLEKSGRTVLKKATEGKDLNKPSVNLLRLILYILLALLIIAVLQWLLPGNLVYIIVLVLLIAAILYFLGEL